MSDLEEQKKMVLPFMQYFKIEKDKRAKEINDLVIAALNQMEKEKPKLALDKETDRYHCEAFALKVFSNADKVDRAGQADLATAKRYLAASYFLEILNHFGPIDGDLLEKQRCGGRMELGRNVEVDAEDEKGQSGNQEICERDVYAAWRAADIRKALREGRSTLPPDAQAEAVAKEVLELPPAYGGESFRKLEGGVSPNASFAQRGGSLEAGSSASPLAAYGLAGSSTNFVQRFVPGSQVLCLGDEGTHEPGTVGQVLPASDGSWRYRVALKDRLQDAADSQLAPHVGPGNQVVFLSAQGPIPATVLAAAGNIWPPTYLLRMPDGAEREAAAAQLSLVLPLAAGSFSAPSGFPPSTGPEHTNPGWPTAPAPPPPVVSAPRAATPTPSTPAPPPPPPPPPPQSAPQLSAKPSVQAIMEAQKNAKYAVSSLNFEDVPAAVKYLQTALRLLTQPPP